MSSKFFSNKLENKKQPKGKTNVASTRNNVKRATQIKKSGRGRQL